MRSDQELSRAEAARLHSELLERAKVMKRRRGIGRSVGACLSIALVGSLLVWSARSLLPLSTEEPRDNTTPTLGAGADTYTIDVTGFHIEASTRLVVHYEVGWAGDRFPGVRPCQLVAMGSGGEVIARQDLPTVYVVEPGQPTEGYQQFPVDAPVADVTATCGDRIDVGQPYNYAINSAYIPSYPHGLAVDLAGEWEGGGTPGVVRCRYAVLDADANVIASQTGVFPPTDPRVVSGEVMGLRTAELSWGMTFDPANITGTVPDDVHDLFPDVACVPYVDGTSETFPPITTSIPASRSIPITPAAESQGWIFSDVVAAPELERWDVRYSMSWKDGVFPGQRTCRIKLLDPAGDVIAADTRSLLSLSRRTNGDLRADRLPASFEASCGPREDPMVAFDISHVSATVADGHVVLHYQADVPAGVGQHARINNQCVAALVQGDNTVLGLQSFSILNTRSGNYSASIEEMTSIPNGATPVVKCEPFQDTGQQMADEFRAEIEGRSGP